MKIQCACGAKYELDVVPGMPPVKFVCQICGQDYSAFVNDLIRRELAQQGAAPAVPAAPLTYAAQAPAPAVPAAPAPPPPPVTEAPRLKISRGQAEAAPQPEQAPGSRYCDRHRTELTTDVCDVCKKTICPQCLQMFGNYCSPFCRNKVEGAKMTTTVTGKKFLAEQEFWQKTGLIFKLVGGVAAVLLGFWFWYAWIGSVPHTMFSTRFDGISHSGTSWIVDGNQIVFMHGGTLARYDLKSKKKVWSQELVTQSEIDDVLKQQDQEASEEVKKYGSASGPTLEPASQRQKYARIGLESELSLHGSGKNIWVGYDDENTLTHYDWDTGNVLQKITVTNGLAGMKVEGNEFLTLTRPETGGAVVTHVSMDNGDQRQEYLYGAPVPAVAQTAPRQTATRGGGLPLNPNDDGTLDPQKVAHDAQNLTTPARIALPALLGNSQHQRQINRELNSEDGRPATTQSPQAEQLAAAEQAADLGDFDLIPDGDSYIAFSSQMLHENIVTHDAMKAPPKTSALNSPDLSTANEGAAINEQLNEMQRNNGGGTVTEDDSTYRVTIRHPGSSQPDWTGDVVGPPQLFPLKNINVLASGKTITVFDKSYKKLWEAQLSYIIPPGDNMDEQVSQYGQGPCIERDGTLYVFDQAVLSAFDISNGNARWRIPSVGIVGVFFDDKGMLYVNTTSGSPDDIKYSRQIDINKQTDQVVMKVNPNTGKILWSVVPGAYISYLSGKYIYAYQSFDPGDDDDTMMDGASGLQKPAYFRIIRINPSNGHTMWFYNEGRAPVDIQFDQNTISIVLKKEVEVLHYYSL
jgi:hypothetical protein